MTKQQWHNFLMGGLLGLLLLTIAFWYFKEGRVGDYTPAHQEVANKSPVLTKPEESDLVDEVEETLPLRMTQSGEVFHVRIYIPEVSISETAAGKTVHFQGAVEENQPGVPELGSLAQVLPGKKGYRVKVDITPGAFDDISDINLAPRADPNGERIPRGEVWGQDGFWPGDLAEVHTGKARNLHVEKIMYHPVQYRPSDNTLRIYRELRATLKYVPLEEGFIAPAFASTSSGFPTVSNATECVCSEPFLRAEDMLPPMQGSPGDFAHRRSGEEADACVKIEVEHSGIQRISYSTLINAGLTSSDLVGNQLRLFHRGVEVPIWVSTSGSFGANDYLVFYGEAFKGYYDQKNAYWLGFGSGGLRMASREATFSGNRPLQNTACKQITDFPRGIWRNTVPATDPLYDGWYNLLLISGARTWSLATDQVVPGTDSELDVWVRGFTRCFEFDPDHQLIVTSDHTGSQVLNAYFDDIFFYRLSNTFSSAHLNGTGSTTFSFQTGIQSATCEGNNYFDFVYVDGLQLRYTRNLVLESNRLLFGGSAGGTDYELSQASSGGTPWVLDVTDPLNPVQLTGVTKGNIGGTIRIRFGEDRPDSACYAVASSASTMIDIPSTAITTHTFKNLGDTARNADYIVVYDEGFTSEALRLLDQRAAQGLTVLAASMEDICNEFFYGVRDVRAIKQFLGYAYHHYQGDPPMYVCLMGDGTYDTTNIEHAETEVIPAPFQYSIRYTATDNWLASVDGSDNMPDIAVGRITANNATQLNGVIDKIISYEAITGNPSWKSRILLTADNSDIDGQPTSEFSTSCERIKNEVVPASWTKDTSYLNSLGNNAGTVKNNIVNAFNTGSFVIHFEGHGSISRLCGENIFDNGDLILLSNTLYSMFNVFTCNAGRYYWPGSESLMEELLRAQNKGIVGGIAPTTVAFARSSSRIAYHYYDALLQNQYITGLINQTTQTFSKETRTTRRIGEAFLNGLVADWLIVGGSSSAELDTYMIYGDPALIVR